VFKKVDRGSSVLLYKQVVNQVLDAIASGQLKTGDRLPPMLELSERIGVTQNTIVRAYGVLKATGIIHTEPTRDMGTRIKKGIETGVRTKTQMEKTAPIFENITGRSSVSVHKQIANQVIFAIASDKLRANDKLPWPREVRERFGIDHPKVAEAYRNLEDMGILRNRRWEGRFVKKGVETKVRDDCRKCIVHRLHEIVCEAKAVGMSGRDTKEIASACYAAKGSPYGKVPATVMALTKKAGTVKKGYALFDFLFRNGDQTGQNP